MIVDVIFFVCIFFLKGLQAHPYKLIMWCSISNFFWMWCTCLLPIVCNLHLNDLLDYSTFGIAGAWKATEAFVVFVPMQITFWYCLLITLNTCLSYDLIATLRNPFKNPKSRYIYYTMYCIVFSLAPAMCRALAFNQYVYGYCV